MKKILVVGMIFILIGGVFCGAAYAAGEKYADSKMTNITKTFAVSGIDKIYIEDYVGSIRIFEGENSSGEILIVAENVAETWFRCEQSGETLNISYNPTMIKFGFISLPAFVIEPFWSKNPSISVYIPEGKQFSEVCFGGGVGDTEIERIQAKSFVINGGLGNYDIKNMYAENLEIKGGVGDVKIGGTIAGDIKINGGVGNIRLNLKGDADDYNVKSKSGLGNIKVGGKAPSATTHGKYNIIIDGGVGDMDININE